MVWAPPSETKLALTARHPDRMHRWLYWAAQWCGGDLVPYVVAYVRVGHLCGLTVTTLVLLMRRRSSLIEPSISCRVLIENKESDITILNSHDHGLGDGLCVH